jgi:hypothetical protein
MACGNCPPLHCNFLFFELLSRQPERFASKHDQLPPQLPPDSQRAVLQQISSNSPTGLGSHFTSAPSYPTVLPSLKFPEQSIESLCPLPFPPQTHPEKQRKLNGRAREGPRSAMHLAIAAMPRAAVATGPACGGVSKRTLHRMTRWPRQRLALSAPPPAEICARTCARCAVCGENRPLRPRRAVCFRLECALEQAGVAVADDKKSDPTGPPSAAAC